MSDTPVWNVLVPVLALVAADTAEDAVAGFITDLERRGLVPHIDPGAGHSGTAFEAEAGPADLTVRRTGDQLHVWRVHD